MLSTQCLRYDELNADYICCSVCASSACALMSSFMRLRSPSTHLMRDMLLRTFRMRRGLGISSLGDERKP